MSFVLAGLLCAQEVSSQDPKERARAARELAKQGSQALPKLEPLLSDRELDVRIEAVKAIVEIDTQHSLDPLVRATGDNDAEIQIRATDGLVNFYLPGYVRMGLSSSIRRAGRAITARFTDVNDQVIDPYITVRPDIIEALGKVARGGSSMESRANAARALGILRGKAAIPDLLEAIRSKDDQVIYESLIAFQKMRDPSVAPRISFLLRDLADRVQIAAIETTGLLQNKEALPQLRDAFERARNKKVRRGALVALAMIPDEGNRQIYERYLKDKDEDLRAAAAEGLGRLRNPADLARLEKAFEEERKTPPRLSLAFAVVTLGKKEVSEFSPLQYLVNRLNSSAWQGVARAFLIELARDPEVRTALHRAIPKGTDDEKIQLAQVMARSGDKDSIPILEALTRDSDAQVAQEGLRALRALKARMQ